MKTEPIKKKKNHNNKSRTLYFFNEHKIPFDKTKIDSIIEPIIKPQGFILSDDKKNESFRLQYIPCSVLLTVERKTPMEKTSNKLVDLSVAFAVEILNLLKYLKSQHETIICNQIGRAGTSIGANIHETQSAHGKTDFVSKPRNSLKNVVFTLPEVSEQ